MAPPDDSHPEPGPPRTRADTVHSRFVGWIWAVPLAALGVIAWLGFRAWSQPGQDITITFDNVHGLSRQGSNIVYRGLAVGRVSSVTLVDGGSAVAVHATIDSDAAPLLRTGTRFWLQNASPSLGDLSSLGAVLSGPSIALDPGPGAKQTAFKGLDHRPVAPLPDSTPKAYRTTFDGAVGDLAPGDEVKLRGFTVGQVRQVGFSFDPQTDTLSTPVTLDLYPTLFHVDQGPPPQTPAALATLISGLVQHGLRAKLERDPPLIGSEHVVLDMTDAGAPAAASDGQLPAEASGGGIGAVMAQVKDVPIGQIGQNVLAITAHLETLAASPQLHDAIAQLDAALTQAKDAAKQADRVAEKVDGTVAAAGPKLDRLIERLDRTAEQLDRAATSTDRVMSGTTSQYGIDTATREVTEAARSLRELANFLDRHPEALIRGRQ